ncbi:ferritin-like domain-containing protein [Comamonas endophytica]|uniref:Ferritin-like domain-containing protein n=1 Tax=Comamonas endophytica TaxID=2949090 RepID=A0ABY6GC92_9BURK|nr:MULTISPECIES: ferritin-like domain-containing protein [unclassified Acidovorax]MCD2513000.1 ferritin-like domain-containing protein [Acidovorax sp. D4N7]UYG52659.1 ferritin-like domain-containing protein [Acidovorax sp. 5MLIR]
MEPTTTGMNKTGATVNPDGVEAMVEAVQRYSPPTPIDTSAAARERLLYLRESDAVGSVPKPASLSGTLKTGVAQLLGDRPELLMDKIGERIAFERGGVRLYDALMVKFQAAAAAGVALPPIAQACKELGEDPRLITLREELPEQTLARIRAEELAHFHMLCDAMRKLGGDPTAQTPCADVIGTASMGLIQVVSDPRTTLAQSFNAMLTAELTDNAGWELLVQLTDKAGEHKLAGQFLQAQHEEAQHVLVIRSWLTALLTAEEHSSAI